MFAPLLAAMLMQQAPDFTPVEPGVSNAVIAVMEEREGVEASAWIARLDAMGDAGDMSAWELLGELFMRGDGDIAQDLERGCDYFERIGDRRGDALHSLAHCYFAGNGRQQDQARARELYRKAIDAGFTKSLCGLGAMLVRGEGGPADAAQGVALCRQAAELGDADAQTDLGFFLLTGNGVERNSVAARMWLEEAGAQRQSNAAHVLGQIYSRGDGVAEDVDRAIHWFEIAHEAGRPDSSWELARMWFRRGYRQDGEDTSIAPVYLSQAREWALIAAETHPDAETRSEAARLADVVGGLLARTQN